MYSDGLVEWAVRGPSEVRLFERRLIHLIVSGRSLNSDPAAVVHLSIERIKVDRENDRRFMHELCRCYLLESVDSGDSILISPGASEMSSIPSCSLTRFAKRITAVVEKGHSDKYANSKLRIERKTARVMESAGTSLGVADQDVMATEQLTCSVSLRRESKGKNSFGVLQVDEETSEGAGADLEPNDVCCICLEPLLLLSRAMAGQTVSLLRCGHVLHYSCAHDALVAGVTSKVGSTPVLSDTFTVTSSGSVVPTLGPIKCPQCRVETNHMEEIPYVVSTTNGIVIPIAPTDQSSKKVTRQRPRRDQRNQQDLGPDEQLDESRGNLGDVPDVGASIGSTGLSVLMGMGFQEAAARTALEGTGGDPDRAIEILLG